MTLTTISVQNCIDYSCQAKEVKSGACFSNAPRTFGPGKPIVKLLQ